VELIFFSGWMSLLRILIIGTLAYALLIGLLRTAGKRTLSKMNAFDLIITVSLGSTLATALLSRDVSLADGVVAFVVLIGLQFAVSWSSVRSRWVRELVTGEPRILLYRGEPLPSALRRARVSQEELQAAIRAAGLGSRREAEAVVLETDGSFSVIPFHPQRDREDLAGIAPPEPQSTERSFRESP